VESRHVCVLSVFEVRELVEGQREPDCKKHRHIKRIDAEEMTPGIKRSVYFYPIANWVGEDRRRIQMRLNVEHVWKRRKTETGHVALNLVEKK
jgi:hypothetical protein